MKDKELKLLNASLKLFVEKGFHGTSTAEIARTAGVATGTLFHYFNTKEELVNELYLYSKEDMLSKVNCNYDNQYSLKENLRILWLNFICYGVNESDKFRFILIFHQSPFITSLTHEQIETRADELLEVYKRGVHDNLLKNISFELIMDFFWGNIVSIVNHLWKYPDKLNKQFLDETFELIWNGISTE